LSLSLKEVTDFPNISLQITEKEVKRHENKKESTVE